MATVALPSHINLSSTRFFKLRNYTSLHILQTTSSPTRHPQISCCLALDRKDDDLSATSITADDNLRIIFAAGGTGGHIYPAVAIADELKSINPRFPILFLGSETGMEQIAIPSAGYDFISAPSTPLIRPLFSPQNLLLPFHLFKSISASCTILSDFDPQIVIGTGGYVSFPVCIAAALKGIKLVIQEQNSVPGIANRVLGLFADTIFVAFDSCSEFFPKGKCVLSGNPVRASLRRYVSKAVARSHFFKRISGDLTPQLVLILGGSLGANSINIAVLNMYYQMLLEQKNILIIWQTGVYGFDEMDSLVKNHPRLLLTKFLHTMDLAYAAADVVVSRAGAMTCSEILAAGKPSILIPSPNVAEGHQTRNASIMASIAGSKVLTEDELDSTTLLDAILTMLGDESLMAEMSEKAMKAALPDASAQIAQSILSLVKKGQKL
ncbi:UDP-Glycosyltransferase superfamily protein isoform X2 [Tasmannia lanceolata]|uniref:UDP-Glycosyltransferase superfamily protein isoform X2 n=1 Tax=Tasmannia lanceolata TaxID=3420 RepID=UPI004062D244